MPREAEVFGSGTRPASFGGTITFHWAPSPILVAKDIEAGARYLDNMTLPLMAARDLGIADVHENFVNEHDPDGAAWAPWSESYEQSGQTGIGILKQTMALMGASTSPQAWPVTAREVFFSFGALPDYGIFHQVGASRTSAGRGVTAAEGRRRTAAFTRAGFDIFAGRGAAPEYSSSLHANPLPARPFAGIQVETQFKIIDIFDAWFGGAIGLAMGSGARGQIQTRIGGRFGPNVTDFNP